MRDTNLVGHVSNILFSRNSDKPWMTATGLSRRLKEEPAKIESILREHAQKPGREVRYSYYPSEETLDILWGHVANVGEQRNLPALERLDEPVEYNTLPEDKDAPRFFISHNHRDLEHVIGLRDQLVAKCYDVWIFESEIPQGVQVSDSVRKAIEHCEYFISYISARSIGSLWVQKEVEAALRGVNEVSICLDGADRNLMNLFGNWRNTWPPDRSLTKEFCRASANSIGKPNNDRWLNRCEKFITELNEYLRRTENRVVGFPSPQNKNSWKSEVLRLESLSEFLERISK
jgi:hypothetical protein